MQISELKPEMVGIRLTVKITDIGAIRDVKTKFGTETRVATATITDDSGEAKLSLWADQIEKVKPGDTIEIVNGMVREWQGELQISIGRQGELKVL